VLTLILEMMSVMMGVLMSSPKLVHLRLFISNPPKNSLVSHVAGKKQHIMPSTANASQTRHIVITDEDSDGGADADQVPAKCV
jgi:hypothetical protein